MLLPGDLTILRRGIEAGMSQMLLEQSEAVSGVIDLHGTDTKGISETMSDELTNEILGKFGAYFFRTGITPWDPAEVKAQVNDK